MSDDDTIIIRKKLKAVLTAPASVKRWHLVALALACFVAGALIF